MSRLTLKPSAGPLVASSRPSRGLRGARAALAAALCAGAVLADAGAARAETPVTGTGKGIAGGALLGGEVVMLTMGAFGVEETWPYLVFGGLGAVGGGVGGYFVEQNTDPKIPMFMLAGGLGLVIPTLVVTLNATSYKPPQGDSDPVQNQPASDPPAPGEPVKGSVTITTSKAKPRKHAPSRPPRFSLVDVDVNGGKLALGVPAVEVRPLYSTREIQQYGLAQKTEVRVPVFGAQF